MTSGPSGLKAVTGTGHVPPPADIFILSLPGTNKIQTCLSLIRRAAVVGAARVGATIIGATNIGVARVGAAIKQRRSLVEVMLLAAGLESN